MSTKEKPSRREILESEIRQYEYDLSVNVDIRENLRKYELSRLPQKIYEMREEVFELERTHSIELECLKRELKNLNAEFSSIWWHMSCNKNNINSLISKHQNLANEIMMDVERAVKNNTYIMELADLKRNEGEYNQQLRELNRRIKEKESIIEKKKIKYDTKIKHKNEQINNEEKYFIPPHELVKIYAIRTEQKEVERKINAITADIEQKKAELASEITWGWIKWIGWIVLYVLATLVVIALIFVIVMKIKKNPKTNQTEPSAPRKDDIVMKIKKNLKTNQTEPSAPREDDIVMKIKKNPKTDQTEPSAPREDELPPSYAQSQSLLPPPSYEESMRT
ncbi:hypothetical protein OCOL_001476 [Ordospora colligata]